jgi:hypothetical protein
VADADPYPNYITPEEERRLLPPGLSPPQPVDPNAYPNDFNPGDIERLIQMLSSMGAGGGMAPPGGNFGGGNPMLPPGMDALGVGGGDPLGMGGMLNPMSMGLNPAQAAGLRLTRRNAMNALNQNMANAHRAIGRAGGSDYSRHVQNIDDEMMALQEQKIQDNVKNALAYNDQLMRYGQENLANNLALFKILGEAGGNLFRYGGVDEQQQQSPGTFSPASQEGNGGS